MATEIWINEATGERREFTDGETFVMLRTTEGCLWKVGLTASEHVMWITAAEMINKDGYFGISVGAKRRISKITGLSERTINDSLRGLVEKNIIVKIDSHEYLMNPEVVFRFPVRNIGDKIAEYYAIKNKMAKNNDINSNQQKI